MKTTLFLTALILFGLPITSNASQTSAALINALLGPDARTQIVERGQDFAVFDGVIVTTNADGSTSSRSTRFTLLENGLHYQEDGEWKLSEDVIEPFPTGAIARRGPNKAIFSSDLDAETVFDIQTAAGERIRGGVRSIQFTDMASGRTVVLGTVKAVAPGVVVAPNQVVYKSAFEGIDADVLFIWRHNSISQNVILNQKPILPRTWIPPPRASKSLPNWSRALRQSLLQP